MAKKKVFNFKFRLSEGQWMNGCIPQVGFKTGLRSVWNGAKYLAKDKRDRKLQKIWNMQKKISTNSGMQDQLRVSLEKTKS